MTIVAGIDVGSRHDRTALVVLDERRVSRLAHLPVDMPLADQADALAPLLAEADLVCVDATGLGLGLAEALQALGVPVRHVIFGAGQAIRENSSRIVAGKVWLVQRLAVEIGNRLLTMPGTDLGRELVRQLGNMTARITARGGVKLEAPGTAADDLAMALALALLARDIIRMDNRGTAA